ncbi:MAG: hypothetical protein P8101_20790 [Candidatus Thiodiazotropha sp.]
MTFTTSVLHFSTGYEFHVCDKRTVHLDPVASGNYTLNYYLIDETSLDRSEWSTRLQDSKSIVVEKTVDNEPPTGRVLIAGDAIEDQTLTLETTDAIHDADGFEGFSYRWIRHYGISEESGLEVGTDSDSYDLTKDDVRQMVSVIVTQILGASVESQWVGRIGPVTDPLVAAPDSQTVPASGNLTPVDVGRAHAQNDQGEAVEIYISKIISNGVEADMPPDGQFHLQPGTHTLKWSSVNKRLVSLRRVVLCSSRRS